MANPRHLQPTGPANPTLVPGMVDFLGVYEAHLDEVSDAMVDTVQALGEDSPHPGWPTRELLKVQIHAGHELVRVAVLEGRWGPLLERRNLQGRTYAKLGMQFRDWFQLVTQFQQIMTPHLVQTFASDPARLVDALAGMNRFLFLGMAEISRAYFEGLDRLATN